jgi:hypothetical protein
MDAMSEVDPADLARLRSRTAWSEDVGAALAECHAAPGGHLAVVVPPGEVPRCEHCGETVSPDALRRAGYRPVKP